MRVGLRGCFGVNSRSDTRRADRIDKEGSQIGVRHRKGEHSVVYNVASALVSHRSQHQQVRPSPYSQTSPRIRHRLATSNSCEAS